MKTFMQKVRTFIQDEEGASAVEYALLVALIAVAIIVGAGALGQAINNQFNSVATTVSGVGS
jgi:pilus assembly protein Flp/PilA